MIQSKELHFFKMVLALQKKIIILQRDIENSKKILNNRLNSLIKYEADLLNKQMEINLNTIKITCIKKE